MMSSTAVPGSFTGRKSRCVAVHCGGDRGRLPSTTTLSGQRLFFRAHDTFACRSRLLRLFLTVIPQTPEGKANALLRDVAAIGDPCHPLPPLTGSGWFSQRTPSLRVGPAAFTFYSWCSHGHEVVEFLQDFVGFGFDFLSLRAMPHSLPEIRRL